MNDFCWVYIIRVSEVGDKLQVAIAPDLPRMLRDSARHQIVYYRQFSTTLDAVAHKLLLTSLENDSLQELIRSVNPEMRNLQQEFRIE